MAEKVYDCPAPDDLNPIKDSTKVIFESCAQLSSLDRLPAYKEMILSKYPEMSEQFAEVYNSIIDSKFYQLEKTVEKTLLWNKGMQWIHAPTKNFDEGISIFKRITELDPSDFWVLLFIGFFNYFIFRLHYCGVDATLGINNLQLEKKFYAKLQH